MNPLLILGALVCFAASAAGAAAPATLCFEEHNEERRKNGTVKPLTWDAKLAKAAQFHTDIMVNTPCYSHQCTEVNEPAVGDRVTAAGYQWHRFGENVNWKQANCADVMKSWMNSPGHRSNILKPEFTNVGCANGGDPNSLKWTCVFGTPW